jgi:hypothetical protein
MNRGLVIGGVALIAIVFVLANIVFTPSMQGDAAAATEACGSFWGRLGSALSGQIAEECQEQRALYALFVVEPIAYVIGAIMIIAGVTSRRASGP